MAAPTRIVIADDHALFRQGPLQDVCFLDVLRHFSTIQIDGQRQVSLARQALRLFLDPIGRAEIAVQDQNGRKWPLPFGVITHGLDRVLSRAERNGVSRDGRLSGVKAQLDRERKDVH